MPGSGTTAKGGSDETLDRDDERLACGLLHSHDGGPGRGGRGHEQATATGPPPLRRPLGRRRAGDARGPGGITRLAPRELAQPPRGNAARSTDRRRGDRAGFQDHDARSTRHAAES
jgi:hypothetical protein